MSDLAEFLLARIAEDEAVAERCIRRNTFGDVTGWHAYRHQVSSAVLPSGTVAVPAPGFLAECQAKRRIVHNAVQPCQWVLRHLALPYADHPDYDESWRP